eukprot:c22550_g1_i1 orf=117-1646(+)
MKGAMEIGGLFDHVKELICQRKAELLSREDGSSHVFGEGKVETQEQGELMGTSPGKEEFESGLEKEFLLESGHEHGSTLEEIDCCNGKDDDETKIMEDNVIMNIHDSEGIESKDAEKAFPKLIRYAREDLLVLQKNSVDSSEKWDRIVGDVGPVIDELWSLDISRPRRRKGDCHQGGSSQTQIPAKKVSSGMENLYFYRSCEEPSFASDYYDDASDYKIVDEEDSNECSDDEDSLQSLAFLVEGEPDFESGAPQDGIEYLRRVMWETARCPKVKVAKVDLKKLALKQMQYMPLIPSIPDCSPDLLPSAQWKREFIADFSGLRIELANITLLENAKIELLPSYRDEVLWKQFCFGKTDSSEMEKQFEYCKEKLSDVSPLLEDFPAKDTILLPSEHSVDEPFMEVMGGCSPFIRILLSLDEVSKAALFRYHVSWLEGVEVLTYKRALWLFALSAVVDKPLDDITSASFRALLRKCATLRSSKKHKDEELYMLNILVVIAGSYFGQADESVI